MHRDLFAASSSRYVNDDTLLLQDAINQYPGSEPYLVEAWKQFQPTANQVSESESGQRHSPLERFSQKLGTVNQIAIDERKVNSNSWPQSSSL
ncbi:hypothetical protein [Microseira sp. BLCC-F43]|jgi:hypothetical protein|uniref:hypothetical protein n=1 Tax=Microseira sp. BLCC-F43 TaxID=3153602 RepID=UPI0035B860FB